MFPYILGWINFSLFMLITSPFWISFVGRRVHAKGARYVKLLSTIRRIHKPLGVLLLGTAFVHGTLMLGGISLHTGLLVALAIAFIVALGAVYYRTRKKAAFKAHRTLALVCLGLLLVHLIFPNLLYMFT